MYTDVYIGEAKIHTQDSFLFLKKRLPWVGFEPMTLGGVLYQLSYQGSSAG